MCSPGRARTYNPSVNSHMFALLLYEYYHNGNKNKITELGRKLQKGGLQITEKVYNIITLTERGNKTEMESALRKARKAAGMTIEEVARKAGTTSATISRYECGKRNIPVHMAKLLGAILHANWDSFYEEVRVDGAAS